MAVALWVLGAVMLLLHDPRHQGQPLQRIGLSALAGALSVPASWPGNPAALVALGSLLWAGSAALAIHFLWAFVGRPVPRWQRGLWLQVLMLPLIPLILPGKPGIGAALLLAAILLLQVVLVMAQVARTCWHTRPADARTLALGLMMIPALWLVVWGLTPPPAGAEGLWWVMSSPLAWFAPMLLIGARLLQRYRQELLRVQVELRKVQAQFDRASSEFEANAAQVSEMRVQQVTEQERKRIAADLHDDLGAKLLTIVHTCENERIAALGREALDEMRLSVRGLSGRPLQLGDAMADWRAETVQRLGQSNIQVEWQALGDEVQHLLPARAYVQTTRILREAVSNMIKHSGASRCEVRCFATEHHYGLVVEDNGRGMAAASEDALGRGHGLSSMKHRAKQLQGQCLVESGIGRGTVIRLSLPL